MPISLKENTAEARRVPHNEQILLARAKYLAEKDRILFEAVMIRRQSGEDMGRLVGLTGRQIRYKVHQLAKRMTSKRFLNAMRAVPYLSPEDARVARMRYCEAISLPRICFAMHISRHQLRRRLDLIRGQIATEIRRQRPQGPWHENGGGVLVGIKIGREVARGGDNITYDGIVGGDVGNAHPAIP